MSNINKIVSESNTVTLDSSIENYPILQVQNKAARARIALHGAHLFEWTPLGQEAVIYNSPESIYREGKALRGGIPICWPWFNAHPQDSSLPSHGFARNRFWELISITEATNSTSVLLQLKPDEKTKSILDIKFTLTLQIDISEALEVKLKTINLGEEAIRIGGALHTYLQVSDISNVTIKGLAGTNYLDTVGEHTIRQQEGDISFATEVDRIYTNNTGVISLNDKKFNRVIEVKRQGSTSAVVWNPWQKKAKSLADLPDDGYKDFVCIEAANAIEDTYLLQKGECHVLSTDISIV